MAAILHVCATCRGVAPHDPVPEGEDRPGAKLLAAIRAGDCPDGVEIREVECLSACNFGCSVSLSAPGKWSYVYGRMTEADADEILAGAGLYAASDNGIVPWRERPVIFRKQSLARIPPQE